MDTSDCPCWDYAHHPRRATVLSKTVTEVLMDLRARLIDQQQAAADTRGIHARLFQELSPPGYPYYAGHYRGEAFRCLKDYEVEVNGDPRVGYPAKIVVGYMSEVAQMVRSIIAALDNAQYMPNAQLSTKDKLLYIIAAACRIFELLLRIHPYADGNGHAARFFLWAILGRYNYWPLQWTIEPRPSDPLYIRLIVEYRNGNPEPLERHIFSMLRGQSRE